MKNWTRKRTGASGPGCSGTEEPAQPVRDIPLNVRVPAVRRVTETRGETASVRAELSDVRAQADAAEREHAGQMERT